MKWTKASLLALSLLATQQASADNLWCTGNVNRMYVDSASRMYIQASYHSSYTMICDLDSDWLGIAPELCKTWFAMLQGAFHAQTPVIVYYSASVYPSCAELPNYAGTPAPGYVMNRE